MRGAFLWTFAGLILFLVKRNCTGLWHCYHHPEGCATVAVDATVGSRPLYQRDILQHWALDFLRPVSLPQKTRCIIKHFWENLPEKEVWRCPNASLSMTALVHMLSVARHGVLLMNMLVIMKFIVCKDSKCTTSRIEPSRFNFFWFHVWFMCCSWSLNATLVDTGEGGA